MSNIPLELIVLILENVTVQKRRRYFTTPGSSLAGFVLDMAHRLLL